MLISNNEDNLTLAEAVRNFSGSKLKRQDDLEKLFSIITATNKNLFDTLLFKAKYIKGLMRIFKESAKNADFNRDLIKKDLSDNITQAKELLKNITRSAEGSVKVYFESNYYVLDPESLGRLDELLSDLEWTKMYLNDVKRKK
ncbi:MAG: hypothetical protein Q8903_09690 [Bacteroidota bacterium]|nr:hypothetical protein [Bacteroidota bacterium]